ncbi:MAG: protein kinase [Pyrinomonadaceae bacterium]
MIKEGEILQERYRIGKQIGQGGMGSVYIATDERFGSTVAIKETLFSDEHFKKAFKREARLLNSLKHSALPKVSDHFIEDNGQYIVMEYIGGDDLFEMMEKNGKTFSRDEVLTWTKQLLDALEYLHNQENPVIHRDIKPQNLKLTSHGQIVLLDFGLAKGNPTDANHQTAANSIFGYSRNYASLEQIQGTGTDPRSDLYSLAATVYHLITGTPPADALTRVMMVLNEEPDPLKPAADFANVDEGLSALLSKTMSLNANQRPQSALEMREMLSDVENGSFSIDGTRTSDKPLDTNIFTQDTEFMSPESSRPRGLKTEMETEVLPAAAIQDSVQTQIAHAGTEISGRQTTETADPGLITRSYPSRKRLAAAALGGTMLLVGSIVAGVYFLDSGTTQTGSTNDPSTKSSEKIAATTGNTSPDSDSTQGSDVNSGSDPLAAAEKTSKPAGDQNEAAPARSGQSKTAEKNVASQDSKQSSGKNTLTLGEDEVVIRDGKIITKDGTISDGKIETKDYTIENGRVTVKKMPPPPKPPVSREEYRKLTPAQKRKVRSAMEQWRRAENKRREAEGLPQLPPMKDDPR